MMKQFHMFGWAYRLAYPIYVKLVMPFRRTELRWKAIILNRDGLFALEIDGGDVRLPSGLVLPDHSVEFFCRRSLGLAKHQAALRVVGMAGRVDQDISCYLLVRINDEQAFTEKCGKFFSFVDRSNLSAFVPAEVIGKLNQEVAA